MPPGEVIDLSLSTDDEGPSALRDISGARGACMNNSQDGFRSLVDIDSGAAGALPKKRRLNKTLGSAYGGFAAVEDFCEDRSLGSSEVAVATAAKSHRLVESAGRCNSDFLVLSPEDRPITLRTKARVTESKYLSSDDTQDSFPEDPVFDSTKHSKTATSLSQRTSALLARLDKPTKRKMPPQRENRDDVEKISRARPCSPDMGSEISDSLTVKKSGTNKPSKRKKTTEEQIAAKAERDQLRIANKAQKAKEKEEALEMKRIMKEEKARQKELDAALAEVNKSKLDKKVSGPEMIVDLPASMNGQQVDTLVRELLKNLQIEVSLYQSPMPNMIKWRRKVKSRYNEAKGQWEVVAPMEIEDEKYVICLISAKEFVAFASGSHQHGFADVEAHVAEVKTKFQGCKPIYLIEGLNSWMRKNKTVLNRAYRTAVLNQTDDQLDSGTGAQRNLTSRGKKNAHEHVNEDIIEDALLRLQVIHCCLIHHTATTVESAEWIAIFTQQISTIPWRCFKWLLIPRLGLTVFRKMRMNLDTSFCMESGQIKTGEDKHDTYVKMLQEVVRVTPPIAYGIASDYPSVMSLIEVMRRHGPSALEDIEVCSI
jgi:crossover junction endonuclease EME1